MAINLYDLYLRKARKYGVNYNQATFKETFVDAVNLVYSELNEKVFEADTLQPIGSFDDIIDDRLASFVTIRFVDDSGINDAISGREYWSIEYDLERKSATNGFTDTITNDDATTVTFVIADNTLTVTGDSVVATADLSEVDNVFRLKFTSNSDGTSLTADGAAVELTYSTGSSTTTQSIGTVSSHIISGVSGFEVVRTRFLSEGTLIYDFLMNEGTEDELTDEVGAYTATVATPVWEDRYVEPSTTLDNRYRSALEYGIDWHLQDGGVWGLEDDADREAKWYRRGIRSARTTYQQLTDYTSPLNP